MRLWLRKMKKVSACRLGMQILFICLLLAYFFANGLSKATIWANTLGVPASTSPLYR